jgi:hypothetical protein
MTKQQDSSAHGPRGGRRSDDAPTRRALAMWPGLDRGALARCAGDPDRIARLVSRRTALSETAIRMILIEGDGLDRELWFG